MMREIAGRVGRGVFAGRGWDLKVGVSKELCKTCLRELEGLTGPLNMREVSCVPPSRNILKQSKVLFLFLIVIQEWDSVITPQ